MTIAPASIRTILFDLGSTLWEHADPATVQREEAAADARVGATLRELLSTHLAAADDLAIGHELRERWFRALMVAYAAEPVLEPDFPSFTLAVVRSMGIDGAEEHWGRLLYEAMRVRSLHARVLFPDTLATVDSLCERGYALGIVTNRAYGGPVFLDDLRQMGLLRYFPPQSIAISADLGYRKPHPAIFRHAMQGLGEAVPATAMVGDRLHADVMGARQLGMYAVWRPHADELAMPLPSGQVAPDAVIRQTADLLSLFPERS